MTAINYLFPPDRIHELPTWRFVLHFVVPPPCDHAALAAALAAMKAADWKIVSFPFGLDSITYNSATQSVDVPMEVPEERRGSPSSLADYESDFWRVCGNMAGVGFRGDVYYEAVDWQDDPA
jgi:hypothetical protein